MKKTIFICLFSLMTFIGYSQELIPLIGFNNSSVSGDDADSFDCRFGSVLGVFLRLPLLEAVNIQGGLVYSQQGADYSEDIYSGKYKLDYINVPIMARFKIANGFVIQAGPQIGFLMSAKDEYEYDGESGVEDAKDNTKGIDFGVNLGLGYQFSNGLGIDATYNLGFSNFADGDDLSDVSWKHNVIQVSLSYSFDLSGNKDDD